MPAKKSALDTTTDTRTHFWTISSVFLCLSLCVCLLTVLVWASLHQPISSFSRPLLKTTLDSMFTRFLQTLPLTAFELTINSNHTTGSLRVQNTNPTLSKHIYTHTHTVSEEPLAGAVTASRWRPEPSLTVYSERLSTGSPPALAP